MAELSYISRSIVGLLFSLSVFAMLSLAHEAIWPGGISQDPAIGFDLSLGYGTAVALFPNGKFSYLAFNEGNEDYRIWIKGALLDALVDDPRDSICPPEESERVRQMPKAETSTSRLNYAIASLQQLLGYSKTEPSEQDTVYGRSTLRNPTPLINLITTLKDATERNLGHKIKQVSVSYPSFFTEETIAVLDEALKRASLQDAGCHGDGKSSVSSVVALRQAEFNVKRSNSTLDLVYGPFGLENVIHIENTETALVITPIELFVGETSSWSRQGFRSPTYLIKEWTSKQQLSSSTESLLTNTTDKQVNFWHNARTCLQNVFAPEDDSAIETIYRLILTGTQALDPDLIQTLLETPGVQALIPPSSPLAIRIHRDESEIRRKYIARREGLTCLLTDYQADWELWHWYGEDLLRKIRRHQSNPTALSGFDASGVDPVFAAARGAALYSLESRLLPCHRGECNMTDCPERRPKSGENEWVFERSRRNHRQAQLAGKLS